MPINVGNEDLTHQVLVPEANPIDPKILVHPTSTGTQGIHKPSGTIDEVSWLLVFHFLIFLLSPLSLMIILVALGQAVVTLTSIPLPTAPIDGGEGDGEAALERRTKKCEDRPSRPDQVPDPTPTTSTTKETPVVDDLGPKESVNPLGDTGQRTESRTVVAEVISLFICQKKIPFLFSAIVTFG